MTPDYIKNHNFSIDVLSGDQSMDYRIEFPELNEIGKAWKKYQNRADEFNAVCRYILFMYDKGTPFVQKFKDIEKRRRSAMIESGLDEINSGKKEPIMPDTKPMVEMVVEFLIYQQDKLWAMICLHENLFMEYSIILSSKLSTVNNDKDLVSGTNMKEATRKALMSVRDDLEGMYDQFYNGDKDLKEKADKMYKFTPEKMSKMVR